MRRATLVQLAVFVLVAAVSLGYVGTRAGFPLGRKSPTAACLQVRSSRSRWSRRMSG